MTDEKKYEPAGYRTSGLGPGKTALASEIQKIGRGLRKYQEQAVIDAVFPTGASRVIEHEHKLVPQMGTVSGRFDARDPQEGNPPRLPLTVGLGGGKTRELRIALASSYYAQAEAGRAAMGDLMKRYQDAGATIILDEVHFTDGRPPEVMKVFIDEAQYIGADWSSVEDRIVDHATKPFTVEEFRRGFDNMTAEPQAENPYRYLSYEEMQRLSRQRIPTSGVNQSIYLRSFEPAAPAIVGKPTKHRAKAIAGRKAKRKNRK